MLSYVATIGWNLIYHLSSPRSEKRVAAVSIYFLMHQYGKKYYVISFTIQADLVYKRNTHINLSNDF